MDVAGLNAQSPAKLGWRLRVEPTYTRRFEKTVTLGTPFGLMDSRRYRVRFAPLNHPVYRVNELSI
jgi:hypothetical protein